MHSSLLVCRISPPGKPAALIDFEVLDRSYQRLALRSDVVVVEGAGGWLTPLDDPAHVRRSGRRCGSSTLILVVGLRLGCLNHALLTVESIESRRPAVRAAGWANSVDPVFDRRDENLATLAGPHRGALPRELSSTRPLPSAQDAAHVSVGEHPGIDTEHTALELFLPTMEKRIELAPNCSLDAGRRQAFLRLYLPVFPGF